MTPALAGTATVAMALVIFRAWTQSISINEAVTYALFVQIDDPFHWIGSTNNHVLNSALMRLSVRLFGVSEISARLPALLGASLYISACYRFCRRLDGSLLLKWAALACFLFSPFILDYLVAARGYGLALGFLMTALVTDPKTLRGCILISSAMGLCFASNFSFAFVCAAATGALFLRSWRESGIARGKLLAAYLIPPVLSVWLITAPSLLNFPRQELWYGSQSLLEAFASILDSQGAIAVYVALALSAITWTRQRVSRDTALFGGVFLAGIALHFAAFHALGLLYPKERTGIFFVPLAFSTLAALATTAAGWRSHALTGALLAIAASNFALMKFDHFEQWKFNTDTDRVYSMLTCLNQQHQVNNIAAGWPYVGALNFYRQTIPPAKFAVVTDEQTNPPGAEVYVVGSFVTPTTVEARHLTVVWSSPKTETLLAVPPEQVERLRGSACLG